MNRIEITNPTEEDTTRMDALYQRWTNTELPLVNQFEEEHPDVTPKTPTEKIHAWEDYACEEVGV